MTKIRTRYAPSPTGKMHVGNLRSALYEFLIAKHAGGDFMLRIEDTDQERYVVLPISSIVPWRRPDWYMTKARIRTAVMVLTCRVNV